MLRVKDVDWIPFLTTKLVDDATTHLKLFKQARIKMKQEGLPKSPKNSPRKEIRASPKKMHKRNKSETDVNWYFGNRNYTECRGKIDNTLHFYFFFYIDFLVYKHFDYLE